jgi:hypothetical protein
MSLAQTGLTGDKLLLALLCNCHSGERTSGVHHPADIVDESTKNLMLESQGRLNMQRITPRTSTTSLLADSFWVRWSLRLVPYNALGVTYAVS